MSKSDLPDNGAPLDLQPNALRASRPPETRRRVTSAELFAGTRELVIQHNGESYSLRLTSKGGLILTK